MSVQGDGSSLLVHGPPYPPQRLGLGLTPTALPDVPVCAVFLVLFTLAAVAHMTLFQINLHKRGRKFVFNAAIFGFCFTRICATSLRMAWAYQQRNVSLGLSAQIFVYAGTIILFITNLYFAQRIVRAQHPTFGWSKPFSIWLPIMLVLLIGTILLLIATIVAQFYLPDNHTQTWTRGVQLYGATLFGIAAFLPIPIVMISAAAKSLPSNIRKPIDNFGSGSLRTKIVILIFTATLLSLGAWFRAGTSYAPPTPVGSPSPWYFSKACFYIFDFTIEFSVVIFWLGIRIDQLYIIPDRAKGPNSYGNGFIFAGEAGNEKLPPAMLQHDPESNKASSTRDLVDRSNRASWSTTVQSRRSSQQANRDNRTSWGSARTGSGNRDSRFSWGSAHASGGNSRANRVSWGGRTATAMEWTAPEDPSDDEAEMAKAEATARPRARTVTDDDGTHEPLRDTNPAGYADEGGFAGPSHAQLREPSIESLHRPATVHGATNELGYNSKTGKWTTRPVSAYSNFNAGGGKEQKRKSFHQ